MLPVALATALAIVGAGDKPAVNEATDIVVLRKGTQTVVTLRATYQGPAETFALIIPVPASVTLGDLAVLAPGAVDAVDTLGAPRLVELVEKDPCKVDTKPAAGSAAAAVGPELPAPVAPAPASNTSGEYQLDLIGPKDGAALVDWLRGQHLQPPAQLDAAVQPYLAAGMKILVAKVDATKLHLDGAGRAQLSPLRIHYESDKLVLPLRLGAATSDGTQDVVISVLSPRQRYEAATYANATIPTNAFVRGDVREHFDELYAALLDATLARHPGAAVTEYAWDATTCEPCTGPTLDAAAFQALGASLLDPGAAYQNEDFVLTRLHARTAKTTARDLELVPAPPIAGGRDQRAPDGGLERGPQASTYNGFQARYAIRAPYLGPLTCPAPAHGVFEPRPGVAQISRGSAFARRGALKLADAVTADIDELDVRAAGTTQGSANLVPRAKGRGDEAGCGCQSSEDPRGAAVFALAVGLLIRRRRPR
jgi:MYXO-CTERM domain-containing protein